MTPTAPTARHTGPVITLSPAAQAALAGPVTIYEDYILTNNGSVIASLTFCNGAPLNVRCEITAAIAALINAGFTPEPPYTPSLTAASLQDAGASNAGAVGAGPPAASGAAEPDEVDYDAWNNAQQARHDEMVEANELDREGVSIGKRLERE